MAMIFNVIFANNFCIMIEYCVENVEMPVIDFKIIDRWVLGVVESFGFNLGELCYVFCDDNYIININKQYLSHDYYTDIITFDYTDKSIVSGDLFISLDTVLSNSKKYKQDYTEELFRVIIHGVLHLCGINDKSEDEAVEMRDAEDKALKFLKVL